MVHTTPAHPACLMSSLLCPVTSEEMPGLSFPSNWLREGGSFIRTNEIGNIACFLYVCKEFVSITVSNLSTVSHSGQEDLLLSFCNMGVVPDRYQFAYNCKKLDITVTLITNFARWLGVNLLSYSVQREPFNQ